MRDIYVSTSQIRRFWLRRCDVIEGLARPPKEGERFHSLLLIKKINGVEMNEEQSRNNRKEKCLKKISKKIKNLVHYFIYNTYCKCNYFHTYIYFICYVPDTSPEKYNPNSSNEGINKWGVT